MRIKHLLTLSFLLLSISSLFGQNFEPFLNQRYTHFIDDDGIHSYKIESQKITGSDTMYYLQKLAEATASLPGTCTHTLTKSSIYGDSVLVDANYYYFFNENGDTIFIKYKSTIGHKYPLYKLPNKAYIEGRISDIKLGPVIQGSVYDQIKVFTLSHRDSLGVLVPDPINGKQFHISRNYGPEAFFNVNTFPNSFDSVTSLGTEQTSFGRLLPYSWRVYDFKFGHEFHFKQITKADSIHGNFKTEEIWEKWFVLDTFWNASKTIKDIKIEVIRITETTNKLNAKTFVYVQFDSLLAVDTAQLSWLNNSNFGLHSRDSLGFSKVFLDDSLGPRIHKELFENIQFDSINMCFENDVLSNAPMKLIYGSGLGLTHMYDEDSNGSLFSRRMVYYQIGLDQHGKAINFSQMLGENRIGSEIKFNVYQQNGSLMLQTGLVTGNVSLYSINGQKLKSKTLETGGTKLDVQDLPSGIYLIQVNSRLGSMVEKVIITH